MNKKVKYKESDMATQKAKRFVYGFTHIAGVTPIGTAPKVMARYVVSSKVIEELKKRHYRFRVIGRTAGTQNVQDAVKEHDIDYVIEMQANIMRRLKAIREGSRKDSRTKGGGGGGGTPPSGIFHRLVDEDKMSDCILKIKDSYFHEEKECEIVKKKCNIYDFFMLVHFYFSYIGILEEDSSQLAYCTYLNNKVFGGNNIVNVRSFNNYSKMDAYQNFRKLLSVNKGIRFDIRPELPRPETENRLLAPFQEIGWQFQHSDYFGKLKREKERVKAFIL